MVLQDYDKTTVIAERGQPTTGSSLIPLKKH